MATMFYPPSFQWRKNKCEELNITDTYFVNYKNKPTPLLKPNNLYRTKGDGNCLFRALSYCIAGKEDNHDLIRAIITSYIRDNPSVEKSGICLTNPKIYVESSKIGNDGSWGSEIEIFAACAILEIPIYIYSKYGEKFDWLLFRPTEINKGASKTDEAIYLHHTDLNHYDVVLTVLEEDETYDCSLNVTSGDISMDFLGVSLLSIDSDSSGPSLMAKDHDIEDRRYNTNSLQEDESLNVTSGDISMNSLGVSLLSIDSDSTEPSSIAKDHGREDSRYNTSSMQDTQLSDEDLRHTTSLDIFQFDESNTSIAPYRSVYTSTPKKGRQQIHIAIPDLFQESLDKSTDDMSIHDESFLEEFKLVTSKGGKQNSSGNKLLKKALNDIIPSMKKARRCETHCLESLDYNQIKSVRYKFWSKSFEQRIEWFYDKIKERKHESSKFYIEGGLEVCGSCFRLLYRIDKNFYYKYLKKSTSCKAAGYWVGRRCTMPTEQATAWLQQYANFHADRMPDNNDLMLPYRTRKIVIYDIYVTECNANLRRSICKSSFLRIWHNEFKHLKIKQTNSFAKCKTCILIERGLEKESGQANRKSIKSIMTVHNHRQMTERRFYYDKRDKARLYPCRYMSLIIDGMDQSKTNLPHFTGRKSKAIDESNLLKTHLQGVINHGQRKLNTFIDINEYSHDANLVIHVLLLSISDGVNKDGKLPEILFIQADNCARENKNIFILSFCDLLVRINVFREVHLSFLYVGHTHEDIDSAFAGIAEKLRRNEAETIPKFMNCITSCSRLQGLYDVKGWLEPYINTTSRHSKPLHFKFSKDSSCNTVMSYRGRCTRPWMSTAHPILTAIPSGHPSILLPPMFHKINTDALRKNIDRCRFLMTGGDTQYRWWVSFIQMIGLIQRSKDDLQSYAETNAFWILPKLVNKALLHRNMDEELPLEFAPILDLVDNELNDPDVIVKPRKKNNKKQITSM